MKPKIELTLYDPETDEVKATFTRTFVPWGLLKKALRLSKSFDMENLSEDDLDALAELVVETFGGQFTVADLNAGADLDEMLTVLNAVISRAMQSFGKTNPTLPPG